MRKAEKQREYKVWFELYREGLEIQHNDQGHEEGTETDCPECFPTEEDRARWILRRAE